MTKRKKPVKDTDNKLVTDRRVYCKYCGARLRRDCVGRFCPTKNCQWQHGLPSEEEKQE